MKIKYSYFLLLLVTFCNHQLLSQNSKHKTNYKIIATYSQYHTAMGKGRGVIFRINVSNKDKNTFTIDSFFVKNTPMKFSIKQASVGLIIESNYLVNTSEPSLNKDGSINKSREIDDEIIVQRKYYPSWIIIDQAGKKIKVKIENYIEIKQKVNY